MHSNQKEVFFLTPLWKLDKIGMETFNKHYPKSSFLVHKSAKKCNKYVTFSKYVIYGKNEKYVIFTYLHIYIFVYFHFSWFWDKIWTYEKVWNLLCTWMKGG